MAKYKVVSRRVESLARGRAAAPGEIIELSREEELARHNRRLIDEGSLILVEPDTLTGEALAKRAQELDIKGRSEMSADQLRSAIAEAEANDDEEEEDDL